MPAELLGCTAGGILRTRPAIWPRLFRFLSKAQLYVTEALSHGTVAAWDAEPKAHGQKPETAEPQLTADRGRRCRPERTGSPTVWPGPEGSPKPPGPLARWVAHAWLSSPLLCANEFRAQEGNVQLDGREGILSQTPARPDYATHCPHGMGWAARRKQVTWGVAFPGEPEHRSRWSRNTGLC